MVRLLLNTALRTNLVCGVCFIAVVDVSALGIEVGCIRYGLIESCPSNMLSWVPGHRTPINALPYPGQMSIDMWTQSSSAKLHSCRMP